MIPTQCPICSSAMRPSHPAIVAGHHVIEYVCIACEHTVQVGVGAGVSLPLRGVAAPALLAKLDTAPPPLCRCDYPKTRYRNGSGHHPVPAPGP